MIKREINTESFGNEIYFPCSIFRTFTLVLLGVCVQCPKWLFSVFSWFRFFQCVVQVISEWFWDGFICRSYYWYHFCFYIPHLLSFSCKIFIFKIFSTAFLIIFLSPEIVTSINIQVPFSLSRIMMPGFDC